MKKQFSIIFLAISLFSINGYTGNGVERISVDLNTTQQMSERAQIRLLDYISQKCQPVLLNSHTVNAQLLELTSNRVDQGIIDYTYTVNVQFNGINQGQNESARITLTDYAGNNPTVEWVHIEKVEMSNNQICNVQ